MGQRFPLPSAVFHRELEYSWEDVNGGGYLTLPLIMSRWSLGCQPHPRLTCLCLKSASSSIFSPPSHNLFSCSALRSQIFKPFTVVLLSLSAFPYPYSWSLPFFVKPVAEGCLSSLWGSQSIWKDSWLLLQCCPLNLPETVNLEKVIKAWIHSQTDVCDRCGHHITVLFVMYSNWGMPCTHAQTYSVVLL